MPSDVTALFRKAAAFQKQGQFAEAESLYREILVRQSNHFDARHQLGVLNYRQGRYAAALDLIDEALQLIPDAPSALSNRGLVLGKLARHEEALASFEQVLAKDPRHVEAHNNRGLVLKELRRHEEALGSFDEALAVRPEYPEALNNRGNTLRELNRLEDAIECYDRAIRAKPNFVSALNNRGYVLSAIQRFEEALASFDQALAAKPDFATALLNRADTLRKLERFDDSLMSYDKALAIRPTSEGFVNRGLALKELKRPADALASYDKALTLKPDNLGALSNRGIVLRALRRFDEALASYDRAIAINPAFVVALNNRGNILKDLKRYEDALASFDNALAIKPDYVEALNNRGVVLNELKRFKEALASYEKALSIRPVYAEALINLGAALNELKRRAEAKESFERALAIKPGNVFAFTGLADTALQICDWATTSKIQNELATLVRKRKASVPPFIMMGYFDDASLHAQCAENFIQERVPHLPRPLPVSPHRRSGRRERLKIAYLSADFHRHATTYLMSELFERHDRARFEVFGISFGPDDRSGARRRVIGAFDQFHDVRTISDGEAAKILNDLEVDIAIDLKGYTRDSRPEILAPRPAPVQVNYLGYPGTMGTSFIDYVVADPVVLPFDQQPLYVEKIVHLPDCYQVNDTTRTISSRYSRRIEAGLPDRGFVFCCFNNNYKINPPVFDVWTRLLKAVDGSVLWLLQDNEPAQSNLIQEAMKRGIDPARLIFAPRLRLPDHLARQRLADLFLDTLPYNAHTTASDALWAGLPLITCRGQSFASRVSASLLFAVGIPELVTESLAEYEALALRLARDPSVLHDLRTRLKNNLRTCPLFDTDRFRRHIEMAYTTMFEIWQKNEPPRSFGLTYTDRVSPTDQPSAPQIQFASPAQIANS